MHISLFICLAILCVFLINFFCVSRFKIQDSIYSPLTKYIGKHRNMVGHLQRAQLVKCRRPLHKKVKHEDMDKQGHYWTR